MASPGLLFLLLVSSSLLPPTSPSAEQRLKSAGDKVVNGLSLVKDVGLPFLGLPVFEPHGALISAFLNLALGLITQSDQGKEILNVIKSEFKSLNTKIDKYHAETKWEIWSAAAFQEIEVNVNIAWDEYIKIIKITQPTEEKKRLTNKFIKDYKDDNLKKLHTFLTSKVQVFSKDLAKMINQKLNCHEKELNLYTVLINTLIFKATVMNLFYYKHEKLPSNIDDAVKLGFEATTVMLEMGKSCTSGSMKSVEIEVKKVTESTKNTKKRQKIAHEVRLVLAKSYSSYDWMVVAFITRNSKNKKWKSWDKHTLLKFTEVPDGDITVAVARQVKGKHTMADKVRRAIQRCVTKSVECHQVKKALEACQEVVDNVPVTQTYSAVHAFIDRPHDSYDAREAPEEIFASSLDNSVPYFYKGVCTKYKVSTKVNTGGEFIVLIKSDEDLKTKNPCSKRACGAGTCVPVKDAFVAVCECQEKHYGLNCETSYDNFRKQLEDALPA